MILPRIGNAQALPSHDDSTAAALLGTWEEFESRSSSKIVSESTYTKDGTLFGSATVPVPYPDGSQHDVQFKVRAHWKFNKGMLLLDSYETTPPGIIPQTSTEQLEVASVTHDELVLRSPSDGRERYERRKVNPDTLRFDGVYQVFFGGGSQSIYLRFYPDQYVVAMSYAGSPEEVSKFISRRYSHLPQGKYRLVGSKLAFTTKAERGENDYAGVINGENIACHIHSRITDAEGDLQFVFWKVALADIGTPAETGKETLPADAYSVPPSAEH